MNKEIIIQRLSFIKYIFTLANDQSKQADPLCNAAIFTLHDSIELLLLLSCEYLNIDSSKLGFMEYIAKINEKIQLSNIESMRRFNKARVALKHHGTLISKTEINSFCVLANAFLTENILTIFSINFESISQIDLVRYENTRNLLSDASLAIESKNLSKAMEYITLSFWKMIDEYEASKIVQYRRSPYYFVTNMTFLSSFHIKSGNRELDKFIDATVESLKTMQNAMKLISLGFDYKKFTKFSLISPIYTKYYQSDSIVHKQSVSYNLDEVTWCLNFVIECAIQLQQFDYDASTHFA